MYNIESEEWRIEGFDELRQPEQNILRNRNVVYIYKGTKSKKIYIGQTIHFTKRNKDHYNGKEEKFNIADFDQVIILTSSYFNGSALDDVESQLITYFMADNPKSKNSWFNMIMMRLLIGTMATG